jgi:hypothetical protein
MFFESVLIHRTSQTTSGRGHRSSLLPLTAAMGYADRRQPPGADIKEFTVRRSHQPAPLRKSRQPLVSPLTPIAIEYRAGPASNGGQRDVPFVAVLHNNLLDDISLGIFSYRNCLLLSYGPRITA